MGSMAQKYSLPTPVIMSNSDKALRIAILYMKQTKGLEQTVFKEIKLPAKQNEITMKHTLDKVHLNYLDEVGEKYSLAGKDVIQNFGIEDRTKTYCSIISSAPKSSGKLILLKSNSDGHFNVEVCRALQIFTRMTEGLKKRDKCSLTNY